MTAVRPATAEAAVDQLLEPRIGEALARLEQARAGATLVAATVRVPAIDPISLFAAAAEAGLEAALWLRPSEGLSFVGVGRAWAIEAEGPGRFAEAETAFRELLASARVGAASGSDGAADPNDGASGPNGGAAGPNDGAIAARIGVVASRAGALAQPGVGPGGPVLLGGLGFSGRRPARDDMWAPFGASSMVLPSLLAASDPAGTSLTASIPSRQNAGEAHRLDRLWERLVDRARMIEPGQRGIVARPGVAPLQAVAEQPGRAAWNRIVGMYAGAVGRGRMDKVVLARRIDLRAPMELDVPNALRRLAASAPESTIFAFRRDGRTFLGATPERLVRTTGQSFQTAAIAGTIRRGASPSEDETLAAELLRSDKDREEQRIVVAAIRELLTPVAETLEIDPRPSVMRLRYAQHLVTNISGTLPKRHGLLSVAALLHPTPAVGGEPREAALALIDEHEGFDRGWYAGPVGWLAADGDGELCVALRCGLVERTRAALFAGCGIVADSNPDAEWEESRIKLRAIVAALGIPAEGAG